jgi:hypothetical protein
MLKLECSVLLDHDGGKLAAGKPQTCEASLRCLWLTFCRVGPVRCYSNNIWDW